MVVSVVRPPSRSATLWFYSVNNIFLFFRLRLSTAEGRSTYHGRHLRRSIGSAVVLSPNTFRQPCIASLMFSRASSTVLPCETQPGREGHSITSQPSSPLLIMTLNRIRLHYNPSDERREGHWGSRSSPGRGAGTPESPEPS